MVDIQQESTGNVNGWIERTIESAGLIARQNRQFFRYMKRHHPETYDFLMMKARQDFLVLPMIYLQYVADTGEDLYRLGELASIIDEYETENNLCVRAKIGKRTKPLTTIMRMTREDKTFLELYKKATQLQDSYLPKPIVDKLQEYITVLAKMADGYGLLEEYRLKKEYQDYL